MKIALLVCDDSNRTFPHASGSYVDMFTQLFSEIDHEVELVAFEMQRKEFPEDISSFDGFLSTGGSNSVYEDLPWIDAMKSFVAKLYVEKQKYFGVCFGHQIIAEALGGKVEKAKEGWMVGVKETEITKIQPWMKPAKTLFKLISSHKDQIVKLPPNAETIGLYQGCNCSVLKLEDHFVGVQGHPEFKKEYAQPLMESRKDIIPTEVIEVARASFASSPDHKLLATWSYNFFKEKG
ncbi:MAG: GMP synthase [Planctomycetota bacterium]|nr:MAG: GMP synthase [Planctomycetota bacterium]